MKEFVEKLIGRLEELGWVFADYYPDGTAINRKRKKSVAYDDVISIVNQLAEEMGVSKTENTTWIPCSERLPNKEEYLKDDGRFIATDGNRVYQGLFDIYSGIFVKDYFGSAPIEDDCLIAWQPLPAPYQKGE